MTIICSVTKKTGMVAAVKSWLVLIFAFEFAVLFESSSKSLEMKNKVFRKYSNAFVLN